MHFRQTVQSADTGVRKPRNQREIRPGDAVRIAPKRGLMLRGPSFLPSLGYARAASGALPLGLAWPDRQSCRLARVNGSTGTHNNRANGKEEQRHDDHAPFRDGGDRRAAEVG